MRLSSFFLVPEEEELNSKLIAHETLQSLQQIVTEWRHVCSAYKNLHGTAVFYASVC